MTTPHTWVDLERIEKLLAQTETELPFESLFCTFEGHSVFSLFEDDQEKLASIKSTIVKAKAEGRLGQKEKQLLTELMS